MLTLSKCFLACAFILVHSLSFAVTCEELKSGKKDGNEISNYLGVLQLEVEKDDLCAKNVLGVILARGGKLPQDVDRAYAIFHSLAERNYPPSQLNLGILLTRQNTVFNPAIVDYLLGIFARYYVDKEWGLVAVSARDLARNYLDSYRSVTQDSATHVRLFEDAVRIITHDTASTVLKEEAEVKERYANIAGMLALGVAASRIASSNIFSGGQTRYFSRPAPFQSPRVYSVHPMGGNYLWVVPH
jgi:hypothetical protein